MISAKVRARAPTARESEGEIEFSRESVCSASWYLCVESMQAAGACSPTATRGRRDDAGPVEPHGARARRILCSLADLASAASGARLGNSTTLHADPVAGRLQNARTHDSVHLNLQ
ncbi:hypothetical protein SVAN01_11160 [Stagonosporopsis vannaccii]|nr:hypothetical protein SVAN01_11160 [Stagonosporopsis vannaccii]